nr:uncharacterized protein LOC111517297 isoform X1 [Leptinotarsa decemlineata]
MEMLATMFLIVSLLSGIIYAHLEDPICDELGINMYEDIGCQAVKKNNSICPIKYECNFSGNDRQCVFKGITYSMADGFAIDFTYEKCNVMCLCLFPGGKFRCSIKDCPQWKGVFLKPGCYNKYEVNKCCAVSQTCPAFHKEPEGCEVDGVTYRIGEKFRPKLTCLTCICTKNFKSEYSEPDCQRMSCAVEINDADKVQQKCAPYYETTDDNPICCPLGWICQKVSDDVITLNPEVNNDPDFICEFGKTKLQLSEGLYTEIKLNGTIKQAKCECIMPPLLTCRNI